MSTFHSAKDMNFTGGNFSIVHGNQSNHYYVHSARSLERNHRVQPGEEWKEMMYQEYERIPLGRIKLKTLLGTVDTRERYTTATTRESLPEAERVAEIASIAYGAEESLPLLAIRYTGRDAKEVWSGSLANRYVAYLKESRDLHIELETEGPPWHSSEHLTILDTFPLSYSLKIRRFKLHLPELVSVQHFLEHNRHSVAARCYLHFHSMMWARPSVVPFPDGSSDELRSWALSAFTGSFRLDHFWFRPQIGALCYGPPGPDPYNHYLSPNMHLSRPCSVDNPLYPLNPLELPPLPFSRWNNSVFFDYVMYNVPSRQVVLDVSKINVRHGFGPAHREIRFWEEQLMTDKWTDASWEELVTMRVLKIPLSHRWSYSLSYGYLCGTYSHLVERMGNGALRYSFPQSLWYTSFTFEQVAGDGDCTREEEWLAQAGWIFSCLRVPRRGWPLTSIVTGFDLILTVGAPSSKQKGLDEHHGSPCYLFVLLPAQPVPDVETWLRGENLYYYSQDPEGGSVINEEERIFLGLPSLTSEIRVKYAHWDANAYDFMEQWQKAKGYDYTTTDYAESLGLTILEVIPQDENRFEDLVMGDDCRSEGLPSEILEKHEPMDVDCDPSADNEDQNGLLLEFIAMDVDSY
ncbi:hypothetical protein PQX77_002634 [Marasmius sp. AFHP31]|nr:hypothetical protein PQX77_002634 [Marasmius sp. AFHP31]